MENNFKVSIIIPIYNTDKYLRQCLDSVINQTFKDIEIIIVNDGSTDNSVNIIKEYQQKDSRIVFVDFSKHKGVSDAKNEGIKIAKGKYITFVDSDDWISKDYINILYDNITKYDCDIVVTNMFFFTKNKYIKIKMPPFCYNDDFSKEKNKKKLLTLNLIWCMVAKIYKKDFIINNNVLCSGEIMDDNYFVYNAIICADNIKFVDETTYFYRTFRENSLTLNENRFYYLPELMNKIKNLLVSKNLYQQYKQSFYSQCYLLLASEIERTKIPKEEIDKICFKIKNEILNEKNIKIKIFDSVPYKIRTYIFIFCLKHNIDYRNVGKILRKVYLFFTR